MRHGRQYAVTVGSVASERDMSYPRREPRPLPSYPPDGVAAARPPRPPLTKRMRRGHWIAIDCVVAAAATLCGMLVVARGFGPGGIGPLADLLMGAGIFAPIALRRRAPVTAFGTLIVLGVLLADTSQAAPALIFLAAAYVLYLVTVTNNRQTGAAALVLALTVILLIVLVDRQGRPNGGAGALLPVAFALIIAWMIGYSVRQRRLYAQMLQHQAASSAVAEERLRIARELHDVVAHSMSVIAVQAGYGQYVIDSSPADAREALGAIQATSRDALEEMRRMLGVLRRQDAAPAAVRADPGSAPAAPAAAGPVRAAPAPLAPAPGLADLDRLIQRTRGAGVQVSLERSGRVRAVPAGVDLSAYRIIQEALTNVVKHAGGSAYCVVSLDYGETALVVGVADDGGQSLALTPAVPLTAGTGHGIIGMRERANLCGGEFIARRLPDGGFQVTAVLPLLGGTAASEPP